MSEDDSDEGDESHDGYCHFNEDGSNTSFSISLFGVDLIINQNPASRSLGHGAVVWDAAVIFAKYMETAPKEFNSSKLQGRKVLELGSGCGLAGIAFMMVIYSACILTRFYNLLAYLNRAERSVCNVYRSASGGGCTNNLQCTGITSYRLPIQTLSTV